jgi:hypothetical protein
VKKFVFLYHGMGEPTTEVMDAWMTWFSEIGESIVDSGNPFGPGRAVTPKGSTELPMDSNAITGYTIVNAESMEAAEKLLTNCPMISSVNVYEAVPM